MSKAGFIRQLLEQEQAREPQSGLLDMFSEAAAHVTEKDIEERES